MVFLKFDKAELVNLEYSLSRELLRSNRAGSYASTTISGCNTRKYHGLLVCPVPEIDRDNHVLLSSLDLTVIQHEKEFNLGIHKYEGDNYVPKGHKYIRDYDAEKASKMTYRVGGVVLTRETMLVQKKEQILIRIKLTEAHSETKIQFRPFLAFRNVHLLSKANLDINRHYSSIPNGVRLRLYDGYPELNMQLSKKAEFVPVPDWYYNVEYLEEQKRGYDFKEDLYVPGYFELPIKKDEEVIFSASLEEVKPLGLKRKFQSEVEMRTGLYSYKNCLINSAEQFLVKKEGHIEMISGFPWYGMQRRDTFKALPGLTMHLGDFKTARTVLDTMVKQIRRGLFPVSGNANFGYYNTADSPLWFIWALQSMSKMDVDFDVWKKYQKAVTEIIYSFMKGTDFGIRMLDNGLITAGVEGIPVTWMGAMVNGHPVTPRTGLTVEVNALWYNAVCQVIEWAGKGSVIGRELKDLPEKIAASFVKEFWSESKGYLADYVTCDFMDFSVRPNMVIAAAMDYSPLSTAMKKSILDVVKSELLTQRGLRTLAPKNEYYEGVYEGNEDERESKAHQGSVYPWLLEHFSKAYLSVYKRSGLSLIKDIYYSFGKELTNYGIGTIPELYDGNAPHYPKGAMSYAASVASLISMGEMIDSMNASI